MHVHFTGRPPSALYLALLILPALAVSSLLLGAGPIGPAESLKLLLGQADAQSVSALPVLLDLRLPRTLAALLVGSALGVAGGLLQAVTRNPLAEPGLLGVNAGAALGVVLGITYAGAQSGPAYLLWAGMGAMAGNACVLAAAHWRPAPHAPLRLVLAGVALGASFQGLTATLLLGQPAAYEQYRFWELGSLAGVTLALCAWAALPIVSGLVGALILARPLSALLLGDDLARSLGHRPVVLRLAVAVTVTLLTGSAVALCGPVAFLGLLAPFLARGWVGSDLSLQLPVAAGLGASLLLAADLCARLVAQPFETPLSALTALLGAPLLVWLARRDLATSGVKS
ncbi:FecCD family ABC transporter permease [Chitinimonas sp. BJB300]|uniref:FecCD family ABC transporter permease n=1 Tax=Chitinimonas sp. BJB300 TaxID=1559339 RepID=UPI000C0F8D53|nr:iron ABC transporter permease [Chitinimonas sp. BJB300]PHV11876.1 ABC transporter permease [Chitinimonas sp. BJB300]TSJ87765.1 iron ABC transporter permease [Chitinimonas sp. BJB300]